eukprot:superscaffoldBa00002888_g15573
MSSTLKVHSELKAQVETFRAQITSEAEHLVASVFPQKLLELDNFLKEPILNVTDLKEIHSEIKFKVPEPILFTNSHDGLDTVSPQCVLSGVDHSLGTKAVNLMVALSKNNETSSSVCALQNTKKRKLEDGVADENWQGGTKTLVMPEGMMKCNTKLMDLIERVKPEIRTLIEKCNTVKMWVQLLIPRIEDGNNFGVSIQEETVAELRTVESEAASYLDQISRYYITRAKLVSKIIKYPHVEDYRRTVSEIDEKEYISLKIIVSELRNQY